MSETTRGPVPAGDSVLSAPIRAEVTALPTYAFVRLADARERLAGLGRTVIDFTVGEPREETPEFVRRALAEAVPVRTSYPPTAGTPALRQAAVSWLERRFGVSLEPDRHVLATLGSKEALYSLAAAVVRPGERDLVLVPDPAYPIYATGARLAGAEVSLLPLREELGFLPDLDAIPRRDLDRAAILWINYPNNPTGASAPFSFLAHAAELARRHGFWLASDEAYADIYDAEPHPSALQCGERNVIAFHSLSKRSAMAGFRSGFLAGDAGLVAALRRLRPSQGVAMPDFVQAASVLAWNDDLHAGGMRELYRRKRALLAGVLVGRGARVAPTAAGFFLYFRPPGEETAESCTERMLGHGIALVPAAQFGARGSGWIRMALVPTLEQCEEAARILAREL